MKNLRIYGNKPFDIAVIHGGPGAPGEMAPVARELSSDRGVLEPLQTATTLKGQVQELRAVLEKNGTLPVTLIGFSWGAMLSFIFTAQHPSFVKKTHTCWERGLRRKIRRKHYENSVKSV